MHENELWQDLKLNGERVEKPRRRGEELPEDHFCAAAHLWVWRYDANGQKEILLQRRSRTKKSWPGFYDASATGHVNFGEEPIISVLREAQEEINLQLQPSDVTIAGVYRLYARNWRDQKLMNELQWIYIHEMKGRKDFVFTDGEVEAIEWILLDSLENRMQDKSFKMVKHDKEYFTLVINTIKRQ